MRAIRLPIDRSHLAGHPSFPAAAPSMNLLSPRTSQRTRVAAFVRCALATVSRCVEGQAAAIVGWQIGQGTPATFGLDTNSPTIGDGSPENADASSMFASFPTITLLNSGDGILLTGTLTLTGIVSTDTGTNQQLRFGLFDRSAAPPPAGGSVIS